MQHHTEQHRGIRMANEQPANKTKAKAAFLKQANHFARLGTATDQDVATLIDSMSAMLASVLKKPISIQINGVHADLEHNTETPSAERCEKMRNAFAAAVLSLYEPEPTEDESAPDIHIDLMGLSVRAMDALYKAGVSHASQIAALTKSQLSEIKGIGKQTTESIIDTLQKHGLTLAGEA
jgi:predicted flap endonuclease-1-like 5' DNA nuclease